MEFRENREDPIRVLSVDISKSSAKQPSITLIDDDTNARFDAWKFSSIGRLDLL